MSEWVRDHRALVSIVATAAVLLVLPFGAATGYELGLLTTFCTTLLLLTGLNLISGYGGQLSLGQGTFFGIGAYFAAIGSVELGLSPLATLILAPIVATIIAIGIGLPSLRLRGLYFAMATLGIAVVFELLLNRAADVTGGPDGIGGIEPLAIGGIVFDTPISQYLLAATLAVVGLIVAQLFMRSQMGWGLRAAKASEPGAAVVGIDTFKVRLVAFALSGGLAGVAGALEAFHTFYISPPSFTFYVSVLLFVALTIGGMGTYLGPIIGAFILYAFDRWLTGLADYQPLILAAIFLVCLRLFPRGIATAIAELFSRSRTSPPTAPGRPKSGAATAVGVGGER